LKNKSIWIKILVCFFPFFAVSFVYIFRDALIYFGTLFPACPSYTWFDIYCPGCGNTRSIQHFLKGDILGSIRFNPIPILGMLIGALAYIELITFVFGKHIKLIPRSRKFWVIVIIAFSIYFIIRNFVRLF